MHDGGAPRGRCDERCAGSHSIPVHVRGGGRKRGASEEGGERGLKVIHFQIKGKGIK